MHLASGTESIPISFLAILALGFFLGMRHATDADHVVAVSTIVSQEKRLKSAVLIGAIWGFGHTATIFAVGTGIIVFDLVIPPRLGLSMEFSVGLMLILLGGINLFSLRETSKNALALSAKLPAEPHADAGQHEHRPIGFFDKVFGGWSVYQWLRPLLIGLMHGMAGSAAVALLVLATLHNSRWALAYLLVFGAGTVAGMMVITLMMASALRYAGSRSAWINRRLSFATGYLSLAFGLFIVYQMGYLHSLFGAHPAWTPQ